MYVPEDQDKGIFEDCCALSSIVPPRFAWTPPPSINQFGINSVADAVHVVAAAIYTKKGCLISRFPIPSCPATSLATESLRILTSKIIEAMIQTYTTSTLPSSLSLSAPPDTDAASNMASLSSTLHRFTFVFESCTIYKREANPDLHWLPKHRPIRHPHYCHNSVRNFGTVPHALLALLRQVRMCVEQQLLKDGS